MDLKEGSFINEVHLLRGLAIILITSSHFLYTDLDSLFYSVISIGFQNSTILFAFVSGYLFQYLLPKFSYKKYLWRKIKYVAFPYLLVSIPALILRVLQSPSYMALERWPDIVNQPNFTQIGYYLSTGTHLIPFWYIPMILIYFILAPLFKTIDDNPKWYWLLILLFPVSIVFYRDVLNMNDILRMFIHFFSVYVFGMFYSRYRLKFDEWMVKNRLIIILATGLSCLILFRFKNEYPVYFQLMFVQKILLVIFILDAMKGIKEGRFTRLLGCLAETSFGIYFIHFYFILAIRTVSSKILGTEYPDSPLIWLISFLLVLVVSHCIVLMIKKLIGRHSRLLIGS